MAPLTKEELAKLPRRGDEARRTMLVQQAKSKEEADLFSLKMKELLLGIWDRTKKFKLELEIKYERVSDYLNDIFKQLGEKFDVVSIDESAAQALERSIPLPNRVIYAFSVPGLGNRITSTGNRCAVHQGHSGPTIYRVEINGFLAFTADKNNLDAQKQVLLVAEATGQNSIEVRQGDSIKKIPINVFRSLYLTAVAAKEAAQEIAQKTAVALQQQASSQTSTVEPTPLTAPLTPDMAAFNEAAADFLRMGGNLAVTTESTETQQILNQMSPEALQTLLATAQAAGSFDSFKGAIEGSADRLYQQQIEGTPTQQIEGSTALQEIEGSPSLQQVEGTPTLQQIEGSPTPVSTAGPPAPSPADTKALDEAVRDLLRLAEGLASENIQPENKVSEQQQQPSVEKAKQGWIQHRQQRPAENEAQGEGKRPEASAPKPGVLQHTQQPGPTQTVTKTQIVNMADKRKSTTPNPFPTEPKPERESGG